MACFHVSCFLNLTCFIASCPVHLNLEPGLKIKVRLKATKGKFCSSVWLQLPFDFFNIACWVAIKFSQNKDSEKRWKTLTNWRKVFFSNGSYAKPPVEPVTQNQITGKKPKQNKRHICHCEHMVKIGTKGIVETTHFLTFTALNN